MGIPILQKKVLMISVLTVTVTTILFLSAVAIRSSFAADPQYDVFTMYAGSLVKIMEQVVGPSFHNQTGYNFVGEGKGSVQLANLILDGFRRPDIFISADTLPIKKLMDHNPPLSKWLEKFASAELVIAYNPNSRFAPDLQKAARGEIPWYNVVEKEGFKFSRTDPELDPKGYFTVIAAQLANNYYNDSSIKQRILGPDRNQKQIYPEEILRSLLDSGQVDAIVAYKHEAVARGLPYVTLPAQINLGDPNYSKFYNQSTYVIHSNQTIFGHPIYFSYTIPTTVRNMDGAISFGNFLTSPQGKAVLEKVGLNPINATVEGDAKSLPSGILTAR
ncbi:MAG TPA: extracellular solute-binding protein [Nitrososphaeraceae archaeon]